MIAYGRLIPNATIDDYVSIDPFKVGQQQAASQMQALAAKAQEEPEGRDDQRRADGQNAKPYKDGAPKVLKQQGAKIVQELRHARLEPGQGPAGDGADDHLARQERLRRASTWPTTAWRPARSRRSREPASIRPPSRSTGQDAELAGVQRILAGEQLMTVYQPINKIAETSAELAVPLAQGKTPPADLTPDKVDNGSKAGALRAPRHDRRSPRTTSTRPWSRTAS